MIITYAESPSFAAGWCVRIHTGGRKKTIQVYDFPPDRCILATSRMENFPPNALRCELPAREEVALLQLLDKIEIRMDRTYGLTLDGTLGALAINYGSSFVGLEWNPEIPSNCHGIRELVDKLKVLAQFCRDR